MNIVFEVTNHAIERYIERRKGIEDPKKIEEMIAKNRAEIVAEISNEVMNSDFVYTDYRGDDKDKDMSKADEKENTVYFINEDTIYIFVGGHIRTIKHTQVSDPKEIELLKKLIVKHRKSEGTNCIQARNYAMVLIGHSLLQGVI